MAEGLHVISGRVFQLTNESSMPRCAFKYKEKNFGVINDLG